MANTVGRQVVALLVNKSGGSVALGDVVVADGSNDEGFTTTTSAANTSVIGVAAETIANNATGRIIIGGYVSLVNVNASVTRNQFGTTHTVAKQATSSATRVAGTFCRWLKSSATPSAYIYPVDLAGAALTNPMDGTGQMIYGGTAGAPTKLAAGTTSQVLIGSATVPAWGAVTGAMLNPDNILPWHVVVIPMVWTPEATTGTWALTPIATASLTFPFYTTGSAANSGSATSFTSLGAQNDAASWDVILAAGTWDAHFYVMKSTNTGIITLNMDGASQGTVDTYAAAAIGAKVSITGFTVSATGKKRMQVLAATKNGSSSGYFMVLFGIEFRRTA